ncbi:helix-turn-helix domain-containing protein [Phosphitispora sp. TUW77]|uniref:helix-turn-helix domain-containing protein n=1 Tax=Phosphitispora sp. TUW77 TaxID=3152361 RepID=UPI003AB10AF0
MGGIGETLKNARESKGISLSKAEEDTKIRKKYLQALETGNYDVLPGKVYAKGFLRNYANYLGLNQEEILMEYKLLGTPVRETFQESEFQKKFQQRKVNRSKRKTYLMTAIVAFLAIITLIVYGYLYRQNGDTGFEDKGKASPIEQTDKQQGTEGQQEQQEEQQLQDQNESVLPPAGGSEELGNNEENVQQNSVTVVLKGKDQICWIKVRVDGANTFTGNLNPGETKTFSGSNIIMTLGNAGAVEVIRDGTSLGVLGEYGDVVRDKEFIASTM